MITGYIKGQQFNLFSPIAVSDSIGYLTAQFFFTTPDWNNLVKTAYFAQGDNVYPFVLQDDKISADMQLNLQKGTWKVYLTGNDQNGALRVTTSTSTLEVKQAGFTGEPLSPLPPSEAEQILAIASKALSTAEGADEKAVNAQPFAERAESAAGQAEIAAQNAKVSEQKSAVSELNAEMAEQQSSQNLKDLLAMLGEDIATLVDGKIPLSQIPATATQEVYVVTSEDDLIRLTAQRGDLAELIDRIDGNKTITKVWQLLGDAANRDDWVVWGTSYAVQAGNATFADNANNSARINGKRMVAMTFDDFETAIKDPDTYYTIYEG